MQTAEASPAPTLDPIAGDGLHVFERAARRVAGEVDVEKIVGHLVDEARQLCRAEVAGFPSREAVGARQVVRVADLTRDPRYAKHPPVMGINGPYPVLKSYLMAPVCSPQTNEILGAIALGHTEADVFTQDDERSLTAIALMAALSIEHSRLLERSKRVEREYARRARQATLAADVAGALARSNGLRPVLQRCAEAVVRNLDAAFARVWTLDLEGRVLELQASAGMYTHLDGAHARVPLGMLKIGRIAAEGEPHLTNAVELDPWIGDREWAKREKLTSFAGYPLAFQGRVVGVLALFGRRELLPDTLDALAAICDTIAVGIDRARADDALRKSEVRNRLVVESSQDGMWFWDIRKNVVDWNDRLFEMAGVPRERAAGSFEDLLERVHAEDRDRMQAALTAHLEEGHPYVVEDFRLENANGEIRICTTKGLAECDARGVPVRMAASITDITERRRAEQAVLEERSRFFNLLMDAPAAIAFVEGVEHRFVFANRQYESMVQRAILGRSMHEVFPEDDRTARDLSRVLESGEALVGREVPSTVDIDGRQQEKFFDFVYEPTRDAHGAIDGVLIHAVEVTQQVEARRQVEQANEILEVRIEERTAALVETNRELEAFSYTVSHDLRAPIRHIAGFIDLLRLHAGTALDAKATRYVDTIGGAAKQMGLLIDGLLAFSRTGRTALTKRTFDGDAMVHDVVSELQPDFQNRKVQIRCERLPTLFGDPTMLRAVMANLLANAVKYTSKVEEAVIEVGRSPDADDGQIVLFVRDNGVGFDMAHIDKLFGVFQRLHGPDEFEGTGIGLATVRRIVQRHGGRAWAESKIGEGATFYLSLPQPAEEKS